MTESRVGITFVGNERDLVRATDRSRRAMRDFHTEAGRATRGALAGSGMFSAVGRNLAFASGGFLTAASAVAAVRGAFSELAQAQTVAAQTNAVIRSTGGVAGVTARDVDRLGNALLRKSGIDDEAIKSGENLLLTFTNVRNVAGRSNDVFNQATRAALDMSVAMGEDLNSAVIRVGKALQDPVKGASALRRVGVLLTDQQQAQIKALVRHNDLLGAQRIILGELNREFGGSAAALGATPIGKVDRLRETIRNFSADVVASTQNGVVPLVDRLQQWFDNAENVRRVQQDVNEVVNTTTTFVSSLADAIDRIHDVEVKIRVNVPAGDKGLLELMADATGGLPFLPPRVAAFFAHKPQTGILGPTVPVSVPRPSPPGLQGPVTGARGAKPPQSGLAARDRAGATAAQRNQWFDTAIGRKLDRVQDVKTLRGQVSALKEIETLVRARLAKTRDITRQNTLREDELLDITRRERGLQDEIRTNANEKKRLALEKEREKIAKERARAQERLAREREREARQRARYQEAAAQALAAIGEIGQGPVLTGPQMDAVRQWGGHATIQDYIADLAAENRAGMAANRDFATLARRHVAAPLIKTLRGQGAAGLEEAHALATATPKQLRQFEAAYKERQRLVTRAARMEIREATITVHNATVHTNDKKADRGGDAFKAGVRGRR